MHPFKVAIHFSPLSQSFWLALFHDTVEDGYLPACLCRVWSGLDAITRRTGEIYQSEYIRRVGQHPIAAKVKMADLTENMKRAPDSLKRRYERALRYLTDTPPQSRE